MSETKKKLAPELQAHVGQCTAFTCPDHTHRSARAQLKALLAVAIDAHYLAKHYAAAIKAGKQVSGSEVNLLQSVRRLERVSDLTRKAKAARDPGAGSRTGEVDRG